MPPSLESVANFNRFVPIPTHDSKPDGRPLYAYKFTDKDYNTLKRLVILIFVQGVKGGLYDHQAASFCLFATETWRRCHSRGSWKWETVFNEIGRDVPAPGWRETTISSGLDWWSRKILLSPGGHREFLVTIACEGGLPLRLLKNENNPLRDYFKLLMTDYHCKRQLLDCDIYALARRHAMSLPSTLRHDIVYKLSGDLIRAIVDLQEKVPDAPVPVAALDQQIPDWRNNLPLPLDDETAERLLKNLVNKARELAITERQKIRWQRLLLQKGDNWSVEQVLNLPRQFSGMALRSWCNDNSELSHRIRFFLQKNGESDQVALLTRQKGEGEQAVYGCEVLRHNGVRLIDKEVIQGARLLLNDGVTSHTVPVQGEHEPGPLPWIFRQLEGRREFIGEGSMRCQDDKVFVLAPKGGSFDSSGSATKKGDALALSRELYEVSGLVDWLHPELGTCRIQCAALNANEGIYLLDGRRVSGVAEELPPFLGIPSVFVTHADGNNRRIVERALLEWRPAGFPGIPWRNDVAQCAGVVWVRYCERDGQQLLLRKIRVMPTNSQVLVKKIGAEANEAGIIQLAGLGECTVLCDNSIRGSECVVRSETSGVTLIECLAEAGLPVTQFSATLSWPEGGSLVLQLPFPRQGAAFVRAGKSIDAAQKIVLSRLAGYHAVVQATVTGRSYILTAKVSSPNNTNPNLKLVERLLLDSNGRAQFDLHRIQDRLSSMMAMTGDLDAHATLEIQDTTGCRLASTWVERFDLKFTPDYDNKLLPLDSESLELLEDGWDQGFVVKMIRLWNPGAEPVVLERDDSSFAWHIPDMLESGPWLVLGEEGDLPRCRPAWWQIDGEQGAVTSDLAQAVREQDSQERQTKLTSVLQELATNPNHQDWSLFFSYLRLTRRYPASTFDVLSNAITQPEVMVAALLHSTGTDFDILWELSEQLPFSWHLIPISAWLAAASQYFSTLQDVLSAMEDGEKMVWQAYQEFREKVVVRQPFFQQVCDWLSEFIFPGCNLVGGNIIAVARQYPDIFAHKETGLIAEEERKFQDRHGAEERYPDGPRIMEWQGRPHFPQNFRYQHIDKMSFRSVRCAPFVAADIALTGMMYDDRLLFELQVLRDFDTEWFDAAYALGLCLGLASLPNETN